MVKTPLSLQSDFLLVKEVEDVPDETGAIVSPYGRHASVPMRARVILAGAGYLLPSGVLAPMLAQVNDIVWLQFNAGTEARIGGEAYRFVLDRDLFGVEEKGKKVLP